MATVDTTRMLDRLSDYLRAAREARHPAIRAQYLAQLQRLSGHALYEAVTECRQADPPMTWRNIAPAVQVPFGTLYRQYQAGGRIVVSDPGAATEPNYDAPGDDA